MKRKLIYDLRGHWGLRVRTCLLVVCGWLMPVANAQTPWVLHLQEQGSGRPVTDAVVQCQSMGEGPVQVFSGLSNGQGVLRLPLSSPAVCQVQHMLYEPLSDTLSGPSTQWALPLRVNALQPLQVLGSSDLSLPQLAMKQVEIVSRETWESRGVTSVDEALRMNLGLQLQPDLILGTTAGLDGLPASLVLITVDGIPLAGRMGAGIDLSRLDVDRFERIEVVRGPMAVRYGSSAMGGVINLVSRQPDSTVNVSARADATYTSDGWATAGLVMDLSLAQGQSLSLGGSRDYFSGWNPPGREGRDLLWNPKTRYTGYAAYLFKRERSEWNLRYSLTHEDIDNKGAARSPFFTTAFDDRYLTLQQDASVRGSIRLGDAHSLDIQSGLGHVGRTKNTFFRDLTTLSSTLVEETGAQDTSAALQHFQRLAWLFRDGQGLVKIETGVSYEGESFRGGRLAGGQALAGEWGPYTEATWNPHARWSLMGGLRYAAHSDFGREWLPAFNLRYGSSVGTWRAEYSRGFRSPNLKERFFEFIDINHFIIGNEDLQAERSHFTALSYDQAFQPGEVLRGLRISASAQHQWVRNGIRLIALDETRFSYGNVDSFRQASFAGSADWQFAHWSVTTGTRLIGWWTGGGEGYQWQPEFSLALSGELPWALRPSVQARHTGAQARLVQTGEDNPEWQRIEAFTWLDVGLGRNFFGNQLSLDLGLRNLLNITNLVVEGASPGVHGGGGSAAPLATGRLVFVRAAYTLQSKKSRE